MAYITPTNNAQKHVHHSPYLIMSKPLTPHFFIRNAGWKLINKMYLKPNISDNVSTGN
jgi:hypothetical protein